jgi:hypothetical protein
MLNVGLFLFPRGSPVLGELVPPHEDEVSKPYFSTLEKTRLNGGSARRKTSTNTGQHNTKTTTNINALSGIPTHDPSIQAAKTGTIYRTATINEKYRPIPCINVVNVW